MKSEVTIDIIGADKLASMFRGLSVRFRKKVVVSTLRKGAQKIKSAIAKKVPARIKGINRALMIRAGGSAYNPNVKVGYFAKERYFNKAAKKKQDAAFVAYWFNYGTMANRSNNRRFKTPRRKKSAHKKGGIRPMYFFENGVREGMPKAEETIIKEFDGIFKKEFEKLNR